MHTRSLILVAALALMSVRSSALATDISDNLSIATGGAEPVLGTQRLCASFKTDASSHTLNSVSLLMYQSVTGSAKVEIYTNSGLEPGALVATLASPNTIPTSLASVDFTTSGVALAANTTYWVVLTPTSGQFAWAWAGTTSGSGAGFLGSWGVSLDGTYWWTQANFPLQMKVVVDACTASSIAGGPSDRAACPGGLATFSVVANGSGTLSYQWRKGSTALENSGHFSNVNTPTLTISPATGVDAGAYNCIVTNSCGNSTSNDATLSVCAADFNCDASVDDADFVSFANAYDILVCDDLLMPAGCPADMNGDGKVDDVDFVLFVSAYDALICP